MKPLLSSCTKHNIYDKGFIGARVKELCVQNLLMKPECFIFYSAHGLLMKQIRVEKGESSPPQNFSLVFSLWSLFLSPMNVSTLLWILPWCLFCRRNNIKQPRIWAAALEMWVLMNIDVVRNPFQPVRSESECCVPFGSCYVNTSCSFHLSSVVALP